MKTVGDNKADTHAKQTAPFFSGGNSSFFKPVVQPKLTVNQPGDEYEREADAVADKVMRMTDTSLNQDAFFKPAASHIQRKCAHCDDEERIRRKEGSTATPQVDGGLENFIGSLNGKGSPLSQETKSFFEPRLGHDLSDVRVHTNSGAAQSAENIGALAYTSGKNIVFNQGQYAPGSDDGKKLLAHELTHVVQQDNNTPSNLGNNVIQRQQDDFTSVSHVPAYSAHTGVQGIEITHHDAPMSCRQRYGVTGSPSLIPNRLSLSRWSMSRLRHTALIMQGPSYGTQNAAALIRLYEAARTHRQIDATDNERFDPIGDPAWAMIDLWHIDAARYREYLLVCGSRQAPLPAAARTQSVTIEGETIRPNDTPALRDSNQLDQFLPAPDDSIAMGDIAGWLDIANSLLGLVAFILESFVLDVIGTLAGGVISVFGLAATWIDYDRNVARIHGAHQTCVTLADMAFPFANAGLSRLPYSSWPAIRAPLVPFVPPGNSNDAQIERTARIEADRRAYQQILNLERQPVTRVFHYNGADHEHAITGKIYLYLLNIQARNHHQSVLHYLRDTMERRTHLNLGMFRW